MLFTGSTGVLGQAAVPLLAGEGHDVAAVSRRDDDNQWLEKAGARPGVAAPCSTGTRSTMQWPASTLSSTMPPQSPLSPRSWEMNDRLRSEATGLLVDSAIANGVSGFIQESITFIYADGGAGWLDEDSPVAVADDLVPARRALLNPEKLKHLTGI